MELWKDLLIHLLRETTSTNQDDFILKLVQQKTYLLLDRIRDILNDDSLSDFDCIEQIVCAFEDFGFSTSRHDF